MPTSCSCWTSLAEEGKDQQWSSLPRVTCTEGLCHHSAAHYTCTCVNMTPLGILWPTTENLQKDRSREGPRSRNMTLEGSTHTGKGLKHSQSCWLQDRVGPSPRQEQDTAQEGWESQPAWAQATGKGARLACLQNPVITEALGQEDTPGTTGLNLLGDTEWQGLGTIWDLALTPELLRARSMHRVCGFRL